MLQLEVQTDNVRVYIDSMMLVVVTFGEFQNTRKASTSNPEKQQRSILVTYLWIVPHIWGCKLGAESGRL